MGTVKSGWLEKQSGTIFKSWKKKYAVLYRDGEFSLYDGPNDASSDTRIQMKVECKKIEVGFACGSINLPKGNSDMESLFCITTKSSKEHYFVALDGDCSDWVGRLETARRIDGSFSKIVPQAPPPHSQAPPQYAQHVQGGPPPMYTNQPMYQPGVGGPPPGYGYPAQQGMAYQQGAYPQQMYMAPGYGQPRYGQQPMYVVQQPQQQQQQTDHSGRNMMLGAGAGMLGGYMLGSMMTHSMMDHHGGHYDGGGYGGGGYDGGGYDGGGFDGGGFDM